ncbi:MAG: SnoaL-like domain protein, partial [Mycobacterium sp.]|nr:SnoaL-like domain protein [Mycobacterium sp.]
MTVDSASTREANKQTLRRAVAGITALDIEAVRAELHDATDFALPFEAA